MQNTLRICSRRHPSSFLRLSSSMFVVVDAPCFLDRQNRTFSVSHFATYFLLPLPYALLLTTVHQQRFYASKSFVFYATRYDRRTSKKRAKLNRPTSVQKTDLPKISSFLLGFIVQRKYRCPARIFPIDLPSSRGHVTKRTRKLRGDARLHQPRTIDDRKSSFL